MCANHRANQQKHEQLTASMLDVQHTRHKLTNLTDDNRKARRTCVRCRNYIEDTLPVHREATIGSIAPLWYKCSGHYWPLQFKQRRGKPLDSYAAPFGVSICPSCHDENVLDVASDIRERNLSKWRKAKGSPRHRVCAPGVAGSSSARTAPDSQAAAAQQASAVIVSHELQLDAVVPQAAATASDLSGTPFSSSAAATDPKTSSAAKPAADDDTGESAARMTQ